MSVRSSRSRSSVVSDKVQAFIVCPSPHCLTPTGRPATFNSCNTFAIHALSHHMRESQLMFLQEFCRQCILNDNEGIDEVPTVEAPSMPVEAPSMPVEAPSMPVRPQAEPFSFGPFSSGTTPVATHRRDRQHRIREARAASSSKNPFGQAPVATSSPNPFAFNAFGTTPVATSSPNIFAPSSIPFSQGFSFGTTPVATSSPNIFAPSSNGGGSMVSVASAPKSIVSDVCDDVSVLSMNSESRRFSDDLRKRGTNPQLRRMLVEQMGRMTR
mmetsp:Transcript_28965/g.21557  ORF Transcript_28965/g.21557 Transcript_28965/m.21557 type:complete len:270 (-) Transcript_28965:317-1126(-)